MTINIEVMLLKSFLYTAIYFHWKSFLSSLLIQSINGSDDEYNMSHGVWNGHVKLLEQVSPKA